jgi:phage terminase small subunit
MNPNFNSKLTLQQQAFVEEFCIDFCQTKAAIRAGYSPKSANQIASKLVNNSEIQNAIHEKLSDYGMKNEILKQRILNQLSNLAFSDIRDYLDFDDRGVTLKKSSDLTREQASAIVEVRQTETVNAFGSSVNVTFKLAHKEKSLELLGRHLAMFTDRVITEEKPNQLPEKKMSFEEFCVNAGYPAPYAKQIEMYRFGILSEGARMILGSRGYGKTDYVVVCGWAYQIYLDPTVTGFLVTKSQERNSAILKEVSTACQKAGVEFEIDNAKSLRVKGLVGKDHSLSAATINSVSLRGRHPQIIMMDDPVTPDDTSESTRSKVKKVYDECYKLTKNVLIIGQPVHKFDLYQTLRPKLKRLEVPHGTIPELDADLEAQRLAGVDEASIQASYHLKILTEGRVPFEKIRFIDQFPTEGGAVAFIDPSFTGGDYTAVTIMKAFGEGVAVVGFCYKMSWDSCIELMVPHFKKYRVQRLCFETNSLGEQPLGILRKAFPTVGVIGKSSNTNKHSRIVAAGAFAHMIHLSKESDLDYQNQVVQYEYKSKYDDAPDSLASCLGWIGLIRGKT